MVYFLIFMLFVLVSLSVGFNWYMNNIVVFVERELISVCGVSLIFCDFI